MATISIVVFDYRLYIGYVDDVRFTWYTFGGMDGWMNFTLVVGAISVMDILTIMDTCDYLWVRFLHLVFYLVQDFMIF